MTDTTDIEIIENDIVVRRESEALPILAVGVIKRNKYHKELYIKWLTPTWFNKFASCHDKQLTIIFRQRYDFISLLIKLFLITTQKP